MANGQGFVRLRRVSTLTKFGEEHRLLLLRTYPSLDTKAPLHSVVAISIVVGIRVI